MVSTALSDRPLATDFANAFCVIKILLFPLCERVHYIAKLIVAQKFPSFLGNKVFAAFLIKPIFFPTVQKLIWFLDITIVFNIFQFSTEQNMR